jgi:parvulin-like peptidyl-prolyl isomerase
MRIQFSQQYKGEELKVKLEDAKKGLLDKLIEDRLILQEAKKENIIADENRVKVKMNEIRKHYSSDIEFQKDLGRQGLVPADIENKIREQMLMYNIIDSKVRNKVIVRPDEVTQFYDSKGNDVMTPELYQVTFVSLENEDLAQAFSYNWREGQKLEDLLSRYPATVNRLEAAKGENLRKDIEEQVFKLGIGEISKPVKIDEQFYIFKLDNIVASRKPALFEVQDKIKEIIFQTKMQQELTKWVDELKNKSYIKVLQN